MIAQGGPRGGTKLLKTTHTTAPEADVVAFHAHTGSYPNTFPLSAYPNTFPLSDNGRNGRSTKIHNTPGEELNTFTCLSVTDGAGPTS